MDWWKVLRPHATQSALWRSTKKFVYAVAGRGSGKSLIAKRKIAISLAIKKNWVPKYVYALPTFQQAKRVVWYEMIEMLKQKNWIEDERRDVNKSEMTIRTKFGSYLYVVGMDKPQRIEGIQIDGIVVDECSDQRPGMFNKTIVPMLTDRNGWAWRIGVPKKAGVGRVEFKEAFMRAYKGNDPNGEAFTWKSHEILTPEENEKAKSQLTEEEYSEQFDAVWLDAGGSIYYAFSSNNVSEDIKYDPSLPVIVGCDFNVSPMSWLLAHNIDGKLRIFDEIHLMNTNTIATLNFLWDKYQAHSAGWVFVGDASAKQRKTSASKSDYILIKQDERFKAKVFFPNRNPARQDRFSTVNAAFRNAKHEIRCLISSKCKRLIRDMDACAYKEGTSEPEDYSGTDIGHMADALGYMVMRYIPLKLESDSTSQIITV